MSDVLDAEQAARVSALKRRVRKARNFPTNTCAASRHVVLIAEDLLRKNGEHYWTTEEPGHSAESMLATVAALWEARTEVEKLRKERE